MPDKDSAPVGSLEVAGSQ